MAQGLKKYFPMIQTREEVLFQIHETDRLRELFYGWSEEWQEEFLNVCTGNKGVKLLYDVFFKTFMNPDTAPERLEALLSLVLRQRVKIVKVLPNESMRIAAESTLLIMDIVVQLEDGSIANVEVQKIGYKFPGERSACYSADLLLRQYKRMKHEKEKTFSYRHMKRVYTIVLIEKSTKDFHEFKEHYLHHFRQKSDTGLEMELLQEFLFIPLDIFKEIKHNKGINSELEAWLTFLCEDEPEEIVKLIYAYPEFIELYKEIYELCRRVEDIMGLFSEELLEMDKNTVQLMIDEMQEIIDEQRGTLNEQNEELHRKNEDLERKDRELGNLRREIAVLKKRLQEEGE